MSIAEEDKELSRSRFGLQDDSWPRKFVEPSCGDVWFLYICYRVVVTTYFVSQLVHAAFNYEYGAKWLLYLTHWTSMVLVLNLALQAWLVTGHYLHVRCTRKTPDDKIYETLPVTFQVMWVLQTVTMSTVPLATMIYWIILPDGTYSLGTLTLHIVTTAYVVLDIFLSGIPVRLAHVYQPLAYVLLYILATVVYYFAGGTDESGRHKYIYKALDYENSPLRACLSILGLILAVVICHFIMFFFYRLKVTLSNNGGCCWCGDHQQMTEREHEELVTQR